MMPTDGLAQEVTYHSAADAVNETYDPLTGAYVQVGEGDGQLKFDDEDNSHWLMWMFG